MELKARDENWLNEVKAFWKGLKEYAANQNDIDAMFEMLIRRYQKTPSKSGEEQIRNEFGMIGAIAPRKSQIRVGILDVSRWGCNPENIKNDRCLGFHCSTCRRCGFRTDMPHENQQGQPCKPSE